MKIAIASENGKTVSRHFGRATQYIVVKTDGSKILGKENRRKVGHADLAIAEHHEQCGGCKVQGNETSAFDRHRSMILNILDCSVLLVGGIGRGAYEGLKIRGIEPIITDIEDIDEAVQIYMEGKIINLIEKLFK